MTYQEAFKELKEIAQRIDSENLDLDQIEKLLSRADELSSICKNSLRRVSDKLNDFQQSQFLE
jgi:exodeoxyribonuclease VII small subunit